MTDTFRQRLEDNRAHWDVRVPVHMRSRYYDIDGWLATKRGPRPWEQSALGAVDGLRLLHLQCHIGTDTLAWARAGAEVVGLDFSPAAVQAATELAERAGLSNSSRFVCADVYEATQALRGERFDIVYVSMGALCWLPDVRAWARQVHALTRPGGRFYIHEDHPLCGSMRTSPIDGAGAAPGDVHLEVTNSYFTDGTPWSGKPDTTYADNAPITKARNAHLWHHTLGDVVSAICESGMRLRWLHEHDWTTWQAVPWLQVDDDGVWRAPGSYPQLPLSYSMLALRRG